MCLVGVPSYKRLVTLTWLITPNAFVIGRIGMWHLTSGVKLLPIISSLPRLWNTLTVNNAGGATSFFWYSWSSYSTQVVSYEQQQAAEALYRDANTLLYADNKPSEDAIDRVIGKLNQECVLLYFFSPFPDLAPGFFQRNV